MAESRYDVIVVGSGICGAVTAWNLARGGAKVLLLEAGEAGPPRVDLVGAFARATAKTPGSPYRGRRGDGAAPGPETRGDYYRSDPATRFRSTYLRRLGGSTWHYLGNVPRFLPSDFRRDYEHQTAGPGFVVSRHLGLPNEPRATAIVTLEKFQELIGRLDSHARVGAPPPRLATALENLQRIRSEVAEFASREWPRAIRSA
jgi:choline dehydrogenase-like flavoprotein